jgi:hypothetical protein
MRILQVLPGSQAQGRPDGMGVQLVENCRVLASGIFEDPTDADKGSPFDLACKSRTMVQSGEGEGLVTLSKSGVLIVRL